MSVTQRRDRVDELIAAWRAHYPEALDPVSELAKRIMVLAADLDAATRRELPAFGLTPAEFGVLTALRRAGPPYRMKPNELTNALLLSSGGTSNVLNRLAATGLIQREADPADGRSSLIRLTATGITVAQDAVRASTAAHAELLAAVPAETVDAATEALRAVFAGMTDGARRHPPGRGRLRNPA